MILNCASRFVSCLQVVEIADVVLEVLDCRDPLGCRSAQAEQTVLQAGPRKRLVLVLNKIGRGCEILEHLVANVQESE